MPRTTRHPGLPDRWPSAWGSVGRQVLLGAILPVAVAVVVLVVLLVTKTFSTAWWVLLIPLAALLWPLSLPGRVRAAMQHGDEEGTLEVVTGQTGVLATATKARLAVRPNAEIVPGRPVRYYLNRTKTPSAKPATT